MAVSFLSSGVDLADILEPIRGTTARANTGWLHDAVDLAAAFMSNALTGLPSVSISELNMLVNSIDISTLFQALGCAPGVTLRQTLSTVGSGTWYASSMDSAVGYRVKRVVALLVGGGGGGGGSANSPTNFYSSGGGGGAIVCQLIDVSAGSVSYTVGAKGAGGATDTNGSTGGSTSFGGVSAPGGGGGLTNRSKTGAFTAASGGSPNGGRGGYYGSSTDYPGAASSVASLTVFNGTVSGGGAAAGSYATGSGHINFSSAGGSYNAGGNGSSSANGGAASGYGGGGGGVWGAYGDDWPGGDGAQGAIFLYY
jgi:hypothetical protein